MAPKLNDILKQLGDVAAAVARPDSDDDANKLLTDALRQLKGPLADIVAVANLVAQPGQNAKTARKLLREKLDLEQGTQLRDFFDNVAMSMIAAQTSLDDASKAYSDAAEKHGLPSSRYAIPNVRAELRFGFSNLSSKGFNVFLFSSQQQRREHSESSVAFDLVATAPPPKESRLPSGESAALLRAGTIGGRRLGLVFGAERESVLDRVLENLEKKEELRTQLSHEPARELAIVLEYEAESRKADAPEPPAPRRFFVVWPGKPVDQEVTVEDWSIFVVAVLEGDALVRDVFERKGQIRRVGNVLLVPTSKDLAGLDQSGLTDLVLNLGDALMNACLIINGKSAERPV